MSRTTTTRHECCRGTWEGLVACERHAEQHRGNPDAPPPPCLYSGGAPCAFAGKFGLEPPYPPLDAEPYRPEPFDLEALLDHLETEGQL